MARTLKLLGLTVGTMVMSHRQSGLKCEHKEVFILVHILAEQRNSNNYFPAEFMLSYSSWIHGIVNEQMPVDSF